VDGNEILLLGLGIQSPWRLVDQRLDMDKQPHELHLTVGGERGAKYAYPVCAQQRAAHEFQGKTWRHLNFFQHHCHIRASVPWVKCPEHGVKLVEVPWALNRVFREDGFLRVFRQLHCPESSGPVAEPLG